MKSTQWQNIKTVKTRYAGIHYTILFFCTWGNFHKKK